MVGEGAQRRKFQVCNGYLLEFEQLARVLNYLAGSVGALKVIREELIEGTGLANRQIESLVSIGVAMGLIRPGNQVLTPIGRVVAKHDVFLEARGTLEWCHFVGAGSCRNLVWYEIFNTILPVEPPMSADAWMSFLRAALAGQYTDRTIGKHLHEEVRFVADAYLVRNFKKLGILHKASDGRLYRRRGAELTPSVLAAMIYDYGARQKTELLQIEAMLTHPGAPGLLFGLEKSVMREMTEQLHKNGWLRYEATHNLDQIRLRPDFTPVAFLGAYYDNSEPIRHAEGTAP